VITRSPVLLLPIANYNPPHANPHGCKRSSVDSQQMGRDERRGRACFGAVLGPSARCVVNRPFAKPAPALGSGGVVIPTERAVG
jgi:hypothetical protein